MTRVSKAKDALQQVWLDAQLDEASLRSAELTGHEPVLPSSFPVGTAAQVSIAAAALAAAEVWHLRARERQAIRVDMRDAALECLGFFSIDGKAPEAWKELSGLYPCGADSSRPGFVRIHANFDHHRDGALRLLDLPTDGTASRDDVVRALRQWSAEEFERAADRAGLVVAALRTFEEWDHHPQSTAVATTPLIHVEKIVEASTSLPALNPNRRPLEGLRVLDLTRILAGPVAGRTLAAYGADVMLVNSPKLPNIDAIADTSRGKLSVHIDLKTPEGVATLKALCRETHIFVQGYRPGSLEQLGFGPKHLAAIRPGIIYVSLSAYGEAGPWTQKRGFDSLVQTATGFNAAEGEAFGAREPRALPMQILDFASGFLMVFGAEAALLRQAREGGSWHVRVSLARTAQWLRSLGRIPDGVRADRPNFDDRLETYESGFGTLRALRHAAQFARTPAFWRRPSMPPGSNKPEWPR